MDGKTNRTIFADKIITGFDDITKETRSTNISPENLEIVIG